MNRTEFDALGARIRDRADRLGQAAGRPDGGRDRFLDRARDLLAIEEVPPPTLDPEDAAEPVIEEASIQGNLGEFPTLTDQGEEETYPHPHDGPRLSDEDASDEGGVLPVEETPEEDLPEVSQAAAADVTASALNAADDPQNDDLNDDGLPDPAPIRGKRPGG